MVYEREESMKRPRECGEGDVAGEVLEDECKTDGAS